MIVHGRGAPCPPVSSVASVAVWVALVWGHGQEGSWSEVIQYVNIKPARLRLT